MVQMVKMLCICLLTNGGNTRSGALNDILSFYNNELCPSEEAISLLSVKGTKM